MVHVFAQLAGGVRILRPRIAATCLLAKELVLIGTMPDTSGMEEPHHQDTLAHEEDVRALLVAGKRAEEARREARARVILFPLVVFAGWAIIHTPLMNVFRGFQIWTHEFGHATVAWWSGYRAIPLPIGWTNLEFDKSTVVYVCLLFLLGALATSSWRERKRVTAGIAAVLIVAQAYMTWVLPESTGDTLGSFAGVGGEFYLSTLSMLAFFVRFPEKFRWGQCRYFFLFIGALTFWRVFEFWIGVASGTETIPYGTMVNGADDVGGDMNKLVQAGWTEARITTTYVILGGACLVALIAGYGAAVTLNLKRLSASR